MSFIKSCEGCVSSAYHSLLVTPSHNHFISYHFVSFHHIPIKWLPDLSSPLPTCVDQSDWSPIGCLSVTPSAQFRLILKVTEYILKKTKPKNNHVIIWSPGSVSGLVQIFKLRLGASRTRSVVLVDRSVGRSVCWSVCLSY